MDIEEKLKEQIKENDILIYMKGTPYAVSYTHLRAHET